MSKIERFIVTKTYTPNMVSERPFNYCWEFGKGDVLRVKSSFLATRKYNTLAIDALCASEWAVRGKLLLVRAVSKVDAIIDAGAMLYALPLDVLESHCEVVAQIDGKDLKKRFSEIKEIYGLSDK